MQDIELEHFFPVDTIHKTAELEAHICHHVLQCHIISAKLLFFFLRKVITFKDGHLDLNNSMTISLVYLVMWSN